MILRCHAFLVGVLVLLAVMLLAMSPVEAKPAPGQHPPQALRGALTAGASSYISGTLIKGFGLEPPKAGALPHLLLHGGVGCVAMAAMDGTCSAGFFAGASQGVLSGSGLSDADKANLAPLVGAMAGFLAGDGSAINVSFGGTIAESGFRNNYLNHKQRDEFKAELARCKGNADCILETSRKYLEISNKNNLELIDAIKKGDAERLALIYDAIPKDMLEYQGSVLATLKDDPVAREIFAAVVNSGSSFRVNGHTLTASEAAFFALRDIYGDPGDVWSLLALGLTEAGPGAIVPNLAGILGARGVARVGNYRVVKSAKGDYEFKISLPAADTGSVAPRALTAVERQKAHHVFGQDKHRLNPMIERFGSKEQAYIELDTAAQRAYKSGNLNINANGINVGQTRILVGDIEVDLVGGRVVDGRFIIGSASRRDIP